MPKASPIHLGVRPSRRQDLVIRHICANQIDHASTEEPTTMVALVIVAIGCNFAIGTVSTNHAIRNRHHRSVAGKEATAKLLSHVVLDIDVRQIDLPQGSYIKGRSRSAGSGMGHIGKIISGDLRLIATRDGHASTIHAECSSMLMGEIAIEID